MAEAVKVIVRCRPMNSRENGLKCKMVVTMNSASGQCSITNPSDKRGPPKNFTFDGAFFIDSTTESIYNDIAYPLVEGVTEGYNGTIFAYGQTGCGKSFSMQGITDPATQRGIIPRAFDHIFETVSVEEGKTFLVNASYLEIYNEEIRDLLGKDTKQKLDLKEHPDKGVYVMGLSKHTVHNVADCEKVMSYGWKNRSTGATLMNADSSRSHSIFTIFMECSEQDDKGEEHIRAGKLNLVDLAGSERQGKTGATGDRLKEATKINLSLSALGNVISALVDGKSKHIPYRDSKLTRLLQDSLGGNTKTLMVACLSPADNNYDETLSTLRYANRAKNIKNKPKINEDPKDALLREFQEEIKKLKAMLMGQMPIPEGGFQVAAGQGQAAAGKPQVVEKIVKVDNTEAMEAEKKKIKEEYEQQLQEMKAKFEQERVDKAKLQQDMDNLKESYDVKLSSVDVRYHDRSQPRGERNGDLERPGTAAPRSPPESVCGDDLLRQDLSLTSFDSSDVLGESRSDMQRAVFIETVPGEEGGVAAPRASPTGKQPLGSFEKEEALKRLQELQRNIVGGEKKDNQEAKERRKKRKMHAEERKLKLAEEISKLDDDGIMYQIFETAQGEVKNNKEKLENEKEKVKALKQEIQDLQSEFEIDRMDYLDTIREDKKQILLLQGLIDKIHPCLRRDCNYINLDRVRAQCRWNEEEQRWLMPQLVVEKTSLPNAGVMPGGRVPDRRIPGRSMNGDLQSSLYDEEDDRYRLKLSQRANDNVATEYFKSKRAEQIVTQAKESHRNLTNQQLNGSFQLRSEPTMSDRAAQVHGQVAPADDLPVRKPQRLESLPLSTSGKGGRKKKHKNHGHDSPY